MFLLPRRRRGRRKRRKREGQGSSPPIVFTRRTSRRGSVGISEKARKNSLLLGNISLALGKVSLVARGHSVRACRPAKRACSRRNTATYDVHTGLDQSLTRLIPAAHSGTIVANAFRSSDQFRSIDLEAARFGRWPLPNLLPMQPGGCPENLFCAFSPSSAFK